MRDGRYLHGGLAVRVYLVQSGLFGYKGIFDEDLKKDLKNDYRRAVLLAILQGHRAPDQNIMKALEIGRKEIKLYLDVLGTSLIKLKPGGNKWLGRNTLFQTTISEETEKARRVIGEKVLSDGRTVKILKVLED